MKSKDLMHQSIPAAPSPLRAPAGHLPALSVPGVGHLQILHCPGAGHSPTPGLEVLVRILALLQKKTLIGTKSRTLKCLKWHYSTVRSMKNVAVLTEDGAFALFFRPHPGGFDSSRVPTPGNLPSKAKKMLMPVGQTGWGRGGGGSGAVGID